MNFSWTAVMVALVLTAAWIVLGYLAGDYVFSLRQTSQHRLRKGGGRDKK